MIKYNEIITKSLIDFEEIKFVLANNNIDLVKSEQIKERYFLKDSVSLKSSNYNSILDNCYVLSNANNKLYLSIKKKQNIEVSISRMEIVDEEETVDFLSYIGYKEAFNIEKNVYVYSNKENEMKIIDLMNVGTFISVRKDNSSLEELKDILSSFGLPFNEEECNESIEKIMLSKVRRHM